MKEKEVRAEHEEFMSGIADLLESGLKMKALMIETGETNWQMDCEKCGGRLHARLAGHKNHLRLWCDGPCKRSMME